MMNKTQTSRSDDTQPTAAYQLDTEIPVLIAKTLTLRNDGSAFKINGYSLNLLCNALRGREGQQHLENERMLE
jgi:hypothetical protein